jgi:hypothetical protein
VFRSGLRPEEEGHILRAERLTATTAAATGIALALTGCAGEGSHANKLRPPAPIVISASIGKDHIAVSPRRFGAGPIQLVVTNQTDRSQQITLASADEPGVDRAGIRQRTGPINPRDTARMDAEVARGVYTVHTDAKGIRPARLKVGARRATSQNDLLLP